jgi:hypothetical protein
MWWFELGCVQVEGCRPTSHCSGRGYRGSTCCRFSFAVVLVVAGRVASAATPLISGPLVSPKMSASILSSQVRSLFYGGTDS